MVETRKRNDTDGATDRLDDGDAKRRRFELQTSLNAVHVRTCADSCRLLLDLLTYLAEDGDLDEAKSSLSDDTSDAASTLAAGPHAGSASAADDAPGRSRWMNRFWASFLLLGMPESYKISGNPVATCESRNPDRKHHILNYL